VPIIIKLLNLKSVVDIGCGQGIWLKEFSKYNTDIFGIDGTHIKERELVINRKFFKKTDLEKKFVIDKKFDIALCLEVAEHLEPSRAKSFVSDLTKVSDVVIFSAAIPFQGGFKHKNLQWQSYWKELFGLFNFNHYDTIRPLIWDNAEVSTCYKQNTLIYSKKKLDLFKGNTSMINMVHPEMLELNSQWLTRVRKVREILHI